MKGEAWVVVGVAGLLGALALVGLAGEVPRFFDPCLTWGQKGGGSLHLSPGGACRSAGGTSETRAEAALRLLLVEGAAIAAAGLAIWGALRARPMPLLAAGFLMVAETSLLFLGLSSLFALTLSAAVLFLAVGWRWQSVGAAQPGTPPAATPKASAARWAGLAVCAAAMLGVGWMAATVCASESVEAVAPGQPQATPHCAAVGAPFVLLFLVPLAMAGAGLWLRLPFLAWAGAGVFAVLALQFSFSLGLLLPVSAAALLAATGAWHVLARTRPPPAA
ncbi:MAG: hypothetical protein QOI63_1607 [Thermoplasmata archaeon]|nr:hypothetical protein [Thermoplasmata archaeon]